MTKGNEKMLLLKKKEKEEYWKALMRKGMTIKVKMMRRKRRQRTMKKTIDRKQCPSCRQLPRLPCT